MSYNPVNWANGEEGGTPMSASNLNRMDKGIADAHEMLADHDNKIDDFANQQIPEEYVMSAVNNYIAENEAGLALKTETEALDVKIDEVNSQLSSEIEEIAEKIGLIAYNLSNISFTSGSYMHYSNGEILGNSNYSYSEYIAITPKEKFVCDSTTSHICFFDEGKNYISGVVTNQTTGGVVYGDTFYAPNNAVYMVISLTTATIDNVKLNGEITIKNNRVVVVDINGNGDYTSVVEAVENEAENTVIFIKSGTYDGTIQAFEKRIILIGADRNTCVLRSQNGSYNYPAINGSCGYFENLTILAEYKQGVSNEISPTADTASYAFHCENEYGVGKTLEFHHCTLKSDFFSALGIGVRKDFTLILNDCELINNQTVDRGPNYSAEGSDGKGLGALFLHDSVGEQGNSYLKIKDTVFKSTLGNAMCLYNARGGNNKVYCEFINNTLYDEKSGLTNNLFKRGGAFDDVYIINGISHGNTNTELNA